MPGLRPAQTTPNLYWLRPQAFQTFAVKKKWKMHILNPPKVVPTFFSKPLHFRPVTSPRWALPGTAIDNQTRQTYPMISPKGKQKRRTSKAKTTQTQSLLPSKANWKILPFQIPNAQQTRSVNIPSSKLFPNRLKLLVCSATPKQTLKNKVC